MISIIIPTHKRANLLFKALEHIYNQTYKDFEVLVFNAIAEPDETDAIREKFPQVIYIKDDKIQGANAKHKEGMRRAKGEFVYMPDDDDYLTDNRFLEKAVKIMEENPKVAFVSGQCHISYEYDDESKNRLEKHDIGLKGYIDGREYLQHFCETMGKPVSTISTLYRKVALKDKSGGEMYFMGDNSLYMQALLWGDAYILDEYVAVYRVGAGSMTSAITCKTMIDTMIQKEMIYNDAVGYIENPNAAWTNQFIGSYLFCPKKNRNDYMTLIKWGFKHSHGYPKMVLFLTKEYIKALFRK